MSVKKTSTFGTCAFAIISPSRKELTSKTKVLNIKIPFEEALKLNLAIDECVRELNSYKRSTTAGRRAALNLTILLDEERIAVNEDKLPK